MLATETAEPLVLNVSSMNCAPDWGKSTIESDAVNRFVKLSVVLMNGWLARKTTLLSLALFTRINRVVDDVGLYFTTMVKMYNSSSESNSIVNAGMVRVSEDTLVPLTLAVGTIP
jgi:hypothetical protein